MPSTRCSTSSSSLLAVALIFFVLGAPFVAALEVIVYAGAIVVLFVFVVILLNLAPASLARETAWIQPAVWIGPSVLAMILLAELAFLLGAGWTRPAAAPIVVGPFEVGLALFGPYLLGVELASLLLLAGLVGAYHIGRRAPRRPKEAEHESPGDALRPVAGGHAIRAGAGGGAHPPQHLIYPDVHRNHAQRRRAGVHRGRRALGGRPTAR